MILRYQKFIQRLNNIQKVCILHNMLVDGLSLVRAPAATAQCYPSQAGRGWFDDEAFGHREVRAAFRIRLLGELAQASTGRRRNITMRALVSGTEGSLICRPAPTFFEGGLFPKGGLE